MPIRQDVQGGVPQPELQGYRGGRVASAQYQSAGQAVPSSASAFWTGLAEGVQSQLPRLEQETRARGYLLGQQDRAENKDRRDVHMFMQEAYTEGFNRAEIGATLSKFQTEAQVKALEYVNAGRSPEEFQAYLQESTGALLKRAGAQGLDLNNQDWQAWLQGVESTRNTADDLYASKNLERARYQKQQAYAAEGNAALTTFVAADTAGNPMQALGNLQTHVDRIYTDNTMSLQEKDGILANFIVNSGESAKSSGAVDALGAYWQELPQFKQLPTEVQTQVLTSMQSKYETRARDEVTQTFEYLSQVRSVQDPETLEKQFPMQAFIGKLNQGMVDRKLTPAQMYSMVNEENVRRLKLGKAASQANAMAEGITMSDISTTSGLSMAKVKSGLVTMYAGANGGYSNGGLALVQRGLQSGAADITNVGIEMLQQDAQSINNIDYRNLKMDADGNPMYPETVSASLQNLKQAYDSAQAAGNMAQANQLLSGLPDAVAYGLRQNADANSLASVVYRRANDINAGRVLPAPQRMAPELLATTADVRAGLLDTNLTQKGSVRNQIGIQSYIFNSSADDKALSVRVNQVNSAISEEYTSRFQQGTLPALAGDDLKNWLLGKVAARSVRVDDGTDNGSLLVLPDVSDKEGVLGSVDNNVIGQGMQTMVAEFKAQYPGAVTVNMRYDSQADEIVLSGVDAQNVELTTSEGIPSSRIRDVVRAVEVRLTNSGLGDTNGALAVPGAGFVRFNGMNASNVDPAVYKRSVNQLISYEGYTDEKGFSILATHPTTGAPLNEAKYVKQPEDSPQVAADKLNMYLNDKVLPRVDSEMAGFQQLPEYLREKVYSQLIETTYHAGNAQAFGTVLQDILKGDTAGAYERFRESPLYKDAGANSKRNKDRMALMQALSMYNISNR